MFDIDAYVQIAYTFKLLRLLYLFDVSWQGWLTKTANVDLRLGGFGTSLKKGQSSNWDAN